MAYGLWNICLGDLHTHQFFHESKHFLRSRSHTRKGSLEVNFFRLSIRPWILRNWIFMKNWIICTCIDAEISVDISTADKFKKPWNRFYRIRLETLDYVTWNMINIKNEFLNWLISYLFIILLCLFIITRKLL